jgi:hypothetical protein
MKAASSFEGNPGQCRSSLGLEVLMRYLLLFALALFTLAPSATAGERWRDRGYGYGPANRGGIYGGGYNDGFYRDYGRGRYIDPYRNRGQFRKYQRRNDWTNNGFYDRYDRFRDRRFRQNQGWGYYNWR